MSRRTPLVLLGLLALVLVAGCDQREHSSASRRDAVRPCWADDLVPRVRRGSEGAGGHLAHLVDLRNVGHTRCTLSGHPLRVTLTEPGRTDVVARRGGFFSGLAPTGPIPPGGATTLVIETDTSCSARPTGGPPGPVYRGVTIELADGVLTAHDPRGLDVGCGAFATEFGSWR